MKKSAMKEGLNSKTIGMHAAENSDKEIKNFHTFFNKLWNGSKPLARLFKTDQSGYLYDTGTNKIIRCDEPIFQLLENLLSMEEEKAISNFLVKSDRETFLYAAGTIKNAIETENILNLKQALPFGISRHCPNYEELIDSSLEIMVLEITESCPMRCAYCVYNEDFKGKRNHGTNHMSLSTAYRAIDYLHKHSFKRDKVALSIYGGEPTLQFPLIQSCVAYANSLLKGKQIDLTITTNGIRLTPEMAEFFCKNDFNVYVSIDGPEEINDSFRVDAKGEGSFRRTVQGLKYLVDAYGELSNGKVGFSMVYTPPFSGKRIGRIAELWDELPWIPRGANINITYPTPGTIFAEKVLKESHEENKNLQQWAYERYGDKYTGKGESHPIADAIMEKAMAQLIQRPIFSEPLDQNFLNGCCIPGVRRIFVTADGRFRLCEKITSDAPLIGDLDNGIDIGMIKKIYLDEYESMCAPVCSRCWAVRLCTSCFTDAFKNGNLDIKNLKNHCFITRQSKERYLIYYCSLLEYNPEGLSYLNKIHLT